MGVGRWKLRIYGLSGLIYLNNVKFNKRAAQSLNCAALFWWEKQICGHSLKQAQTKAAQKGLKSPEELS